MVKLIIISTAGDFIKASESLNRAKKKFPEISRKAMRRWGHILARDMKTEAKAAKIKSFTGTLYNKGIRWEQGKRSDIGFLFMRQYGIKLDSMAPHEEVLTRRRLLLMRWARQAQSPVIRWGAKQVETGEKKSFGIRVRKHPFIANGFRRARKKLKPVMKRLYNAGMAAV